MIWAKVSHFADYTVQLIKGRRTSSTADITVAEKLINLIDFKGSTILADRAYTK